MEDESRRVSFARQIIAYPANVPCPACGGVQDWHVEWTDPTQAPDFYKGDQGHRLSTLWRMGAVQGATDSSRSGRRQSAEDETGAFQAARWAKSQSKQGKLRDYLDQSGPGQHYKGQFTDQEIQEADADAQADPRYSRC